MAQYATFAELIEAEPEKFEPLFQWLEMMLREVAKG